ncbi:hypothetical protein [Peribacillus frigoritolerans]|uniref:Uncharacterized protein n=1 Tax=Peribacillus castrilensis TaxID=2897690 RepID=A0AAW9NPB9_9BACI|nr:hypothetical protein [Peribacillus castrilensis]
MQSLIDALKKDVFQQEVVVDESLIQEYFERNERKKQDDKWLKENKEVVFQGLKKLDKNKADFGSFRASYTVPDNSKFDEAKVLEFAIGHGIYEQVTKQVLDEDALTNMIEQGLIDLEELKAYSWVAAEGTPRVTIKKVKE